jgi:hypothetical protein
MVSPSEQEQRRRHDLRLRHCDVQVGDSDFLRNGYLGLFAHRTRPQQSEHGVLYLPGWNKLWVGRMGPGLWRSVDFAVSPSPYVPFICVSKARSTTYWKGIQGIFHREPQYHIGRSTTLRFVALVKSTDCLLMPGEVVE